MKSIESELEELRARMDRLEARLEAMGVAPLVAAPGVTGGESALPPPLPETVLPPPLPAAPARPSPRSRELSSTVWIASAGAVIFLLGAFYGLTVAIQRGWISPPVRVFTGLTAGALVAAYAARIVRASRGLGVALLATGAGTWTFSLFYGARMAELFPVIYGLAGTVAAVIGCGAVAARVRSDGAMAVSLATGLLAPLVFSAAGHQYPALLVYLAVLSGAQVAVHLVARAGEDWRASRLLGTAGIWLVAFVGAVELNRGDRSPSLMILPVLAALGLVLAWLPRLPRAPWAPASATAVTLIGFASLAFPAWNWNDLSSESFALVLALLAGVSLALVRPARRRTGGRTQDRPLLVLAAGFGAVAVPVAWEWRWVAVSWGVAAVGLAWLARRRAEEEEPGAGDIRLVALLLAAASSAVWAILAADQGAEDPIFLNRVFVGAALSAAAWGLLVAAPGAGRALAFAALQAVAVNAVALEFSRAVPPVGGEEAVLPLGGLLATLTYAVAGAWQWVRGMTAGESTEARALRRAGYAWLAVGGMRLFWHDLAGRDLVFKAAAALGVGIILLVAALWANRRRVNAD